MKREQRRGTAKSKIYFVSYNCPITKKQSEQYIIANNYNDAVSKVADFYSMGRNQFKHYLTNVKIMEVKED